jgi:type I restriction-modification system DNA methylase subunit
MSRNRANGKFRDRRNEILFIDARNMGHLINRRTRELSAEDINTIADTYHNWRNPVGADLCVYPDVSMHSWHCLWAVCRIASVHLCVVDHRSSH